MPCARPSCSTAPGRTALVTTRTTNLQTSRDRSRASSHRRATTRTCLSASGRRSTRPTATGWCHLASEKSRFLTLFLTLAVFAAAPVAAADAAKKPGGLAVQVLSNRADLISAGDALVAIKLPAKLDPAIVRVEVGTSDVTSAFAMRPDGRFEGLLTGLADGRNEVTASAPGRKQASVTILNHANGGPVLSGPQVQPWKCQDGAADEQCNQPVAYTYEYKSSVTGQFS